MELRIASGNTSAAFSPTNLPMKVNSGLFGSRPNCPQISFLFFFFLQSFRLVVFFPLIFVHGLFFIWKAPRRRFDCRRERRFDRHNLSAAEPLPINRSVNYSGSCFVSSVKEYVFFVVKARRQRDRESRKKKTVWVTQKHTDNPDNTRTQTHKTHKTHAHAQTLT